MNLQLKIKNENFLAIKEKTLGKGSSSIIDLATNDTISTSKYNPLAWSRYTKLPKELYHPTKGLIHIRDIDDNECFKWS